MKTRKAEAGPVVIAEAGTYYSVADAAARLNRTRQAVGAAIKRGDLQPVVTPWGYLILDRQIESYRKFYGTKPSESETNGDEKVKA